MCYCINTTNLAEHGWVKIGQVRQLDQHHHHSDWPSSVARPATDPPLTTGVRSASGTAMAHRHHLWIMFQETVRIHQSGGFCTKYDPKIFASMFFKYFQSVIWAKRRLTWSVFQISISNRWRLRISKLSNRLASGSSVVRRLNLNDDNPGLCWNLTRVDWIWTAITSTMT